MHECRKCHGSCFNLVHETGLCYSCWVKWTEKVMREKKLTFRQFFDQVTELEKECV